MDIRYYRTFVSTTMGLIMAIEPLYAGGNDIEDKDEKPAKYSFIFKERKAFLRADYTPFLPDHPFLTASNYKKVMTFPHNGEKYELGEVGNELPLPKDIISVSFESLFLFQPPEIMAPLVKGIQLLEWTKSHNFCGACGSPTTMDSKEYFFKCMGKPCGQKLYPRIQPVVVVAVENGDEILLSRSPSFPPGVYSTIAGFVEVGETLEQAAAREVKEETGINIKNIRYFSSQPWQFPTQLIVGFTAEYAGGELKIDPLELEDAKFFKERAIPPTFPGNDLTVSQKLISAFRHKQQLRINNNASSLLGRVMRRVLGRF